MSRWWDDSAYAQEEYDQERAEEEIRRREYEADYEQSMRWSEAIARSEARENRRRRKLFDRGAATVMLMARIARMARGLETTGEPKPIYNRVGRRIGLAYSISTQESIRWLPRGGARFLEDEIPF